jgi:hypothetical protein
MTTVTVTSDPPTVQIAYASGDLNAATHHIIAYRIVEGVSTSVRSSIDQFAVGGVVVNDYEAPIGPVDYRLQQFDDAGAELGYTDPVFATVPADSAQTAYISDPLDATSGVRVVLDDTAGRVRSRPVPGTLHRVGLRTVALVGQRGLLEDLPMNFYTETLEDRDAILAMIGDTSGLVLIRTAAPVPVPRLLYCWASDPRPSEFDLLGSDEGAIWDNTVQEVSPTEGGLVVGPVTWQTYMDAFPLWSDFNAAYLTWFDAMQNPPEV